MSRLQGMILNRFLWYIKHRHFCSFLNGVCCSILVYLSFLINLNISINAVQQFFNKILHEKQTKKNMCFEVEGGRLSIFYYYKVLCNYHLKSRIHNCNNYIRPLLVYFSSVNYFCSVSLNKFLQVLYSWYTEIISLDVFFSFNVPQ